MGAFIGKQSTEILEYQTKADKGKYEIRMYGQHPVMQTAWMSSASETFFTLADYIGVFKAAQNEAGSKFEMTAPVECKIKENKIEKMRFFPPNAVVAASALPAPLNKQIKIKDKRGREVYCVKFNGYVNLDSIHKDKEVKQQLAALIIQLHKDNVIVSAAAAAAAAAAPTCSSSSNSFCRRESACNGSSGCAEGEEEIWQELQERRTKFKQTDKPVKMSVAIYNPPYTISYFRRNEIWLY